LFSARHPARDFLAHAIKNRIAAVEQSPLRPFGPNQRSSSEAAAQN